MRYWKITPRRGATGWMVGVALHVGVWIGIPLNLPAEPVSTLRAGAYLVVGVFAYSDNAQQYTESLVAQGFSAQAGYYPPTDYVYVYLRQAKEKQTLERVLQEIRKHPSFTEAWLFEPTAMESNATVSERATAAQGLPDPEPAPGNMRFPTEGLVASKREIHPAETSGVNPITAAQYLFFRTVSSSTQEQVRAEIKLLDIQQRQLLGQTSSDTIMRIPAVLWHDSALQVEPYALGYRSLPRVLSHPAVSGPAADPLMQLAGDTLVVQLLLTPWQPGDIQVLFRTYFYPNASVMRPRSQPEMEELIQLLRNHPAQRIKLHGHTNGSGRGYIYQYDPLRQNFFTLHQNNAHKQRGVGAKKLSGLRAITIKEYLVSRGIASERIETQGWGGRKPLYDPDSALGKSNIRVEVELLSP